jgi:hypothetical protein
MNTILHGMMDVIVNSIAQSVPIFYDIVSQHDCLWEMSLWLSNVTHSQLLEGLKCESQIGNNERVRSQGMLPGSQHFKRVEGHAGASGWD